MDYKMHFRNVAGTWPRFKAVRHITNELVSQFPEKKSEIRKVGRETSWKVIWQGLGLLGATVPLTFVFGMVALLHHLGFYPMIAFLGSIVGTCLWVFFLDRSSFGVFAAANLVGILVVGAVAMYFSLRGPSNDSPTDD